MPNPASTSDLEARFYRDLTDREQTIAPELLDDAWEMLLGRRPKLEADLAAATVSERTTIRVLCAMVARVLGNPEGKLAEQIDDYSYRRDSVVSTGLLQVTDDELADVTPGRRSRRSIRLVKDGAE